MSGIKKEIVLDVRYIPRHLSDTPQVIKLLRRGLAVHVFNDEETMLRVAQSVIDKGNYIGNIRNYERYGLLFTEPIGLRIVSKNKSIQLYYGEVKIDANNRYHPIPRTRASR